MERHPKLDVWISHGGGSAVFSAARLAQAGRKRPWATASMKKDGAFETMLRRFWFDAHLNDDLALQFLVDKVGIDRVVFGTNFAGWDQEDGIVARVRTLGFDASITERVLGSSATALFGLPEA